MSAQQQLAAGLASLLVALAACTTSTSTREATTEDLDRILAGNQRSAENRARDVYRHPRQTLLFFGIRPEMKVLEVWPEPGWYSEILAPLLRDRGRYYAAVIAPDPSSPYNTKRLAAYRQKLAANPELYDRVEVLNMPTDGGDVVAPASLDMVVTFRNLHDWMAQDEASQVFATLYKALKPGGVLGIVEHRGNPAAAQDPKAKSGYVNEDYAIRLIEAQGFRLVAKSEVNANPRDTKDYEQGVWTLPPSYRLGAKDRDKYAAIGESDRFTMRFVKPAR
jgi:predicted methyltransferase